MQTRTKALAALTLITCSGLLLAGPLSPPVGSVGPTMKTLAEVEPRTAVNSANTPGDADAVYKITQPGSYYLTGNIDAPAGKGAVLITADNVTLDLNGFTVSSPGAVGALVQGSGSRVCVKNGRVTGGGNGVQLGFAARVANVEVSGCSAFGIRADGESTLTDCCVDQCGVAGIYLSNWRSVVERCHVGFCGGNGLSVGRDSRLVSCTATHNAGHGFDVSGVATGCTASENGAEGIIVSYAGVAESCTARGNVGTGFKLIGSTARGCTSTGNSSYGFECTQDSAVSGCQATLNAVSAVRVSGSYSTIEGCALHGVSGFPVVLVNATTGVRVERNSFYQGTYAVSVDAAATNSLIVGNQCVGNTSGAFSVNLAGNQVGPTVTAAGTIASTSPWANFVR